MGRGIPKPENHTKNDNKKDYCVLLHFNLVQMRSVGFLKEITT